MDPKYYLFAFVGIVVFFQLYQYDRQQAVYAMCLLTVLLGYYYTNKQRVQENMAGIIESFTTDKPVQPRELASRHYQVYRHPKTTKYSYRVKDYKMIIQSLEFMYIYDTDILDHVKALSEAFFKTHYNVMMGKYEPSLYMGELHDFKEEAIALLRESVFVVPKTSTVVDIPDLNEFIEKQTLKLNEVFSRYIRIVAHAFPETVVTRYYEPPFEMRAP